LQNKTRFRPSVKGDQKSVVDIATSKGLNMDDLALTRKLTCNVCQSRGGLERILYHSIRILHNAIKQYPKATLDLRSLSMMPAMNECLK
jgi:hypothetical protein